MAGGPYFTQANLEVAVGGANVLRDLLDKNRDGLADADQVSAVIAEATAEVNSAIQVAVDTTTINLPYPDALVYHATRIGAYYAFLNSTSGMAMPENIRAKYDAAMDWLDRVARGDRTIGIAAPLSSAHDVSTVDVNPSLSSSPPNNTTQPTDGTRLTRNTMRGFY
jgi:phage gp36-like protein